MERIAIALGSNLGDRIRFLRSGASGVIEDCLLNPECSSVYETKPWGIESQPDFLNAVIIGETDWKATSLIHYLKDLEQRLGRTHSTRNGPREIDLDLIAYGSLVESLPELTIPHPRCFERIFVMMPLCDVWPEWMHPVLRRTARQILEELLASKPGGIQRFNSALVPN